MIPSVPEDGNIDWWGGGSVGRLDINYDVMLVRWGCPGGSRSTGAAADDPTPKGNEAHILGGRGLYGAAREWRCEMAL